MKASLKNLWIKFIYSSWSDSSISLFNSSNGFSFDALFCSSCCCIIFSSLVSFSFSFSFLSLTLDSSLFTLYFFPKLIIVVVGLDSFGSKSPLLVHLLLVAFIKVLFPFVLSKSLKLNLNLSIILYVWSLISPEVGGSLSMILNPVIDNRSCMFPETWFIVPLIPPSLTSPKPDFVLSGGKFNILSKSSSVINAFTAFIFVGFLIRSLNFPPWPSSYILSSKSFPLLFTSFVLFIFISSSNSFPPPPSKESLSFIFELLFILFKINF